MTQGAAPETVLSRLLAQDRGRLLAALLADLRHFDLAEEALSDAVESAVVHWRSGPPDRPFAWLMRVARRKAIDRIRRLGRWRDREADLLRLAEADQAAASDLAPDIPDDRLRLIFTCCHPALDPKSRVALTLRTLCGLTTAEIARAFLDSESTMGQRLSRAKAKIAAAGIPFAVPKPEDWEERLSSVLAVIYLVFNEGYAATSGISPLRVDLCDEALFLARLICDLRPGEPEALGLLALILATHARRGARFADGGIIPLDMQDRGLWDRDMAAQAEVALSAAMARRAPGPYQIKAAIAALHLSAPNWGATDWPQMLMLYDSLMRFEGSGVVRLNRAVVLAELVGPARALAEIDTLSTDLRDYQPFHATRAALLARLGRLPEARAAFDRGIALSGTEGERAFLRSRRDALKETQDCNAASATDKK